MRKSVIPLAILVVTLAGLAARIQDPAEAAPPCPELLHTLSPRELRDLPREPVIPPGVTRIAGTGTSGRSWSGHPRVLVILVDFDDRPADRAAHSPAYYRRLLFSRGEADTVSLRDYYLEASYGRLDVTGDVVGWYRMPHPYDYYPGAHSGLCTGCYPHNARALAADAVQAALDDGVDFTRFDNDGPDGVPGSGDDDEILDGLLVVYPGYGAERTGRLSDLRSHYWTMTTMTRVGAIAVPDYALVSGEDNVGVAVHEFGHVLGGEDLYDKSVRGNGLGVYSVMAYGMWLVDATHPSGPDPYTRIQWGFARPETLTADDPDLDIPAVDGEPFVLRLWTRGEAGPEYFLVENRRAVGIDDYLPADGLLVYHVDTTVRDQNDPRRYRVRVVEADGLRSLEGDFPRNLGDAGDAFPGALGVVDWAADTRPDTRANNGDATGVALHRIGSPGPVLHASVEVGRFVAREPLPRMVVTVPGGPLNNLSSSGDEVRLRITNRGARLPAGTLRVLPGAAIIASGPVVAMDALDALETRPTDARWTVRIRPDAPVSGAPVFLEAVWETPRRSYPLDAPIPTEASVRGSEGFENISSTVHVAALREGADPGWIRQQERTADGSWAYRARPGTVPESSTAGGDGALVLGPYELSGDSELRFEQYVSTRGYGAYALDGGFLEASTDGGESWEPVTPEGGYPVTFALADGNTYPGHPAWGGDVRAWQSVRVPLPGFSGPTLFRFHFVSGYNDGWTVDDVMVRSWDPPFAATLDTASDGSGRIRFGVHLRPVIREDLAGEVRLMRDRDGEGPLLLAIIPFRGRQDLVERTADPTGAGTDRFYLAWGPDLASRTPPVTIQGTPVPSDRLLAGTPSVLHLRRGGWIFYRVPEASTVTLDVFDVLGRRVARLPEGPREPGTHRVSWPARSAEGRPFGSGVYFLRLTAGTRHETRRVTLLP
jgi:immune inhibitor A